MADVIPISGFRQPEPMLQGVEPIFTAEISGVSVRYFIPPSATPDLPWCVFEDMGLALGWKPEDMPARTWQLAKRWLPWLKAVATPQGNKILIPCLGAVAIAAWLGDGGETDSAIMGGFAEAMDRSLASAAPSERFQATVLAARSATSPGEVNCLFDAIDMEQTA